MPTRAEITVVLPTLGRHALVRRVLDRLEDQSTPSDSFGVMLVADAAEHGLDQLDQAAAGRRFAIQRLQADRPGASAARNLGWRSANTPLVLFLDDDILPEPDLVAEHLAWHRRHPEPGVGVLGHVRWADELRVTPFMRWLEHGIQFNYPGIDGTEADWGWFYTANVSVKRELVARAGGFEEDRLPFGYEDLDLALRMRDHGLRLLYNRAAVAEHVHPMTIEFWRRRVARIARSEWEFVKLHPDFSPYFHDMFTEAAAAPAARGLSARLARFVGPAVPVIGPKVWGSLDAVYKQALAEPFLASWRELAAGDQAGGRFSDGGPIPAGSEPGGPK